MKMKREEDSLQRHHQFFPFTHRKFRLEDATLIPVHMARFWKNLTNMTGIKRLRRYKEYLEKVESGDIECGYSSDPDCEDDDPVALKRMQSVSRFDEHDRHRVTSAPNGGYCSDSDDDDNGKSSVKNRRRIKRDKKKNTNRNPAVELNDASAAYVDEITAKRQWHGSATGGVSLRITAVSDIDVFACQDARKVLGLCALYVFLHLHGHHVRKLEVLVSSSDGEYPANDDVLSIVLLRALRMCTRVQIVEAADAALAEACMASMGSTINIVDVKVRGSVQARGPDASCAVPFANGSVSRESSISASGLTMDWTQRLLNVAVTATACRSHDGDWPEERVKRCFNDCFTNDRDNTPSFVTQQSVHYSLLTKPEALVLRPHLTTLIMVEPRDMHAIRMFMSAAALCCETLKQVELVDERNNCNTVELYTTHVVASHILEKMKVSEMMHLEILRIVGVRAVHEVDVNFVCENVHVPLRKLALVPTRSLSVNIPIVPSLQWTKVVRHFQDSLELLEIGVVDVKKDPRDFVVAVGETRLHQASLKKKHSLLRVKTKSLSIQGTLTAYTRTLCNEEEYLERGELFKGLPEAFECEVDDYS
ncbi:hypothetical protein V5799_027483 [Amblyomma americanum]|uniref:Uncharacterized protein n=1 Tax=Amblyomma americanum TaxID=6943 RepID=A0AAQ4DFK4_AMBAM